MCAGVSYTVSYTYVKVATYLYKHVCVTSRLFTCEQGVGRGGEMLCYESQRERERGESGGKVFENQLYYPSRM